jgi:SAM-dependent methyltransferase
MDQIKYDADNWHKTRPEYAELIFEKEEPAYYTNVLDGVSVFCQNGEKVLEVGCAGGHNYNRLKKRSPPGTKLDFIGIDITEDYLAVAKARIPEAKWVHGDARSLPFADKEFDVTFSMLLLLHLDKEGARKALEEMCRVTKHAVFIHTYAAAKRYESAIHSALSEGAAVQVAEDGRVWVHNMTTFLFNIMALDEFKVPGWRLEFFTSGDYMNTAAHRDSLGFVPEDMSIFFEMVLIREAE